MSALSIPSRWLSVLAVLLLVAVVWFTASLGEHLPLSEWRESLRGAGPRGVLLFLLVGVGAVAVGLPRQLLAGVAGYAYGFWSGAGVALLAAIGGCAVTVLLSRRFLSATLRRHQARPIAWLERISQDDLFLKILLLRLQPFGTNLATNIAAGVVKLHVPTFLAASVIGYLPQMLVFAMAGSGIASDSRIELVTSIVLFIASLVLAFWLWRRHQTDVDLQ